ncbi:MAG: hypothetical protein RIF41_33075 [Polyangiaceae bacterium]
MVTANTELVVALRRTARRLREGASYQWGHFGACNCGHLAQTLTRRSHAEIHRAAVERAATWALPPVDDWTDAAVEYCPTSGLPLDAILGEMLGAGLSLRDIRHLEELSDPWVLARLPVDKRHLRHNAREDLVLYLDAWADALAAELAPEDALPLAAE